MQIRRESEGEVGENGSGDGGVEVARRRSPWDEAVEEADGDGGGEAEEEAEHRHRYSDGGGHGIHLRQLHIAAEKSELREICGWAAAVSAVVDVCLRDDGSWNNLFLL